MRSNLEKYLADRYPFETIPTEYLFEELQLDSHAELTKTRREIRALLGRKILPANLPQTDFITIICLLV